MLTRRDLRVRGFTLIEMIVAMGIFAILVAVGVPTMRTWISNVKVRAVADALQNGVRLAQSESLRRSRQVVFAMTNSTTPQSLPVAATGSGISWVIYTVPSMTDGSEANAFVDSGILSSITANVPISGQAAICFNSVGRLVANGAPGVTAVTGGAACGLPAGNPAVLVYTIGVNGTAGVDHALRVKVGLGGQVHMCDPSKTLSATNPDGC